MKKIIPHFAIILSAMMITLLVLDYLNPLMGFLSRGISKFVIALWILSLFATFFCIAGSIMKKIRKTNED